MSASAPPTPFLVGAGPPILGLRNSFAYANRDPPITQLPNRKLAVEADLHFLRVKFFKERRDSSFFCPAGLERSLLLLPFLPSGASSADNFFLKEVRRYAINQNPTPPFFTLSSLKKKKTTVPGSPADDQ